MLIRPSRFTLSVLWAQILLQLYRSFLNFARYEVWILFVGSFFCHFFHFVNLVIFQPQCIDSGYLVSTTPYTSLYRSFWNFAHVFSTVWRCLCGLDIYFALIFVTFYTPPHKKWRGIIPSKNFECPSTVRPSALRFRTLTWVVSDQFSSNFAWTLISGRSGLGLQMG